MSDVQSVLSAAFSRAIAAAFGDEYKNSDPLLRASGDPAFGDWQANFAMGLAKRMGGNPRAVAEVVLARLEISSMAEKAEIAGPGFVNVRLSAAFLEKTVAAVALDPRKGVARAAEPAVIVVDYSAPNVAKEMHVGHIRSTIIGDALARLFEFQGHTVLRRNHLGDWGLQFGQLIEHMVDQKLTDAAAAHAIGDLNELYRASKARMDGDPDFAARAGRRVVALQSGDPETLRLWHLLIDESKRHFQEIYDVLGVSLTEKDYYGESFYNDMLAPTTDELLASGVAVVSQGAVCLFPPGFNGRDGEPVPLIVRKSDGGYGYDATDLAAIRHRVRDLGASRIVYVVDARQKQHFAMLFPGARLAGYLPEGVVAEHVSFGSILGDDGKPFKSRSGEVVRLSDLMDEALSRAQAIVDAKSPGVAEAERKTVARAIGIGALKYADLSNDRVKDYVFNWERMLAFDGNTAPYLQNAYVRIQGIFRKAAEAGFGLSAESGAGADRIRIETPEERALAIEILKLPDLVNQVSHSLEPHRLCTYLYGLASLFHGFYEKCPVMNAADDDVRRSRLALCRLVAETLKLGLSLLGIDVMDRM